MVRSTSQGIIQLVPFHPDMDFFTFLLEVKLTFYEHMGMSGLLAGFLPERTESKDGEVSVADDPRPKT